jgi:hypothetical protein
VRRALWVGLGLLVLAAVDCAASQPRPRLQRRARETHRWSALSPRLAIPARVRAHPRHGGPPPAGCQPFSCRRLQ